MRLQSIPSCGLDFEISVEQQPSKEACKVLNSPVQLFMRMIVKVNRLLRVFRYVMTTYFVSSEVGPPDLESLGDHWMENNLRCNAGHADRRAERGNERNKGRLGMVGE